MHVSHFDLSIVEYTRLFHLFSVFHFSSLIRFALIPHNSTGLYNTLSQWYMSYSKNPLRSLRSLTICHGERSTCIFLSPLISFHFRQVEFNFLHFFFQVLFFTQVPAFFSFSTYLLGLRNTEKMGWPYMHGLTNRFYSSVLTQENKVTENAL